MSRPRSQLSPPRSLPSRSLSLSASLTPFPPSLSRFPAPSALPVDAGEPEPFPSTHTDGPCPSRYALNAEPAPCANPSRACTPYAFCSSYAFLSLSSPYILLSLICASPYIFLSLSISYPRRSSPYALRSSACGTGGVLTSVRTADTDSRRPASYGDAAGSSAGTGGNVYVSA
ncbi:hypothetical protein WOLCODRAFT_136610 [Wolfiporia cocos MD-104 SS10]|uniref:Uncharacterized protein n=1 Tax=Wolfiporia cocos (strain MD-104) TaxID=742152 RepID=A0A2H3JTH4_WOLCO|nr:hypothetical protein WOLCODRAFT_136610 [Wolfiporia cocos MD-104 SS10]